MVQARRLGDRPRRHVGCQGVQHLIPVAPTKISARIAPGDDAAQASALSSPISMIMRPGVPRSL